MHAEESDGNTLVNDCEIVQATEPNECLNRLVKSFSGITRPERESRPSDGSVNTAFGDTKSQVDSMKTVRKKWN
jgi:hypothetical protein